jgi:hypothetical protein
MTFLACFGFFFELVHRFRGPTNLVLLLLKKNLLLIRFNYSLLYTIINT